MMDSGAINAEMIALLRGQEERHTRIVMPFEAPPITEPSRPQLHELPVAWAAEPPADFEPWYALPPLRRERKG